MLDDLKHIGRIADTMGEWEGTVADALELSFVDRREIMEEYRGKLKLQTLVLLTIMQYFITESCSRIVSHPLYDSGTDSTKCRDLPYSVECCLSKLNISEHVNYPNTRSSIHTHNMSQPHP